MLARGPERDLVALDLRDHRVRLHRVLVHGGEGVLALDDDVGAREQRLQLAAVERVAVADVAVAGRELAKSVEEARFRRPVGDERRTVGDRVVDRRHDREVFVLDGDRLDRSRSRSRRLRSHRRDLLAVEAHLVDREDRPVLDRVAVVRIDVAEVGAGEDADDAVDPLRRGRVDRDDPAVRDRAAQHSPVQHARHEDVTDELRLAAQLLACVAPRLRSADLRPRRRLAQGGRHPTPARSATASTMPR